MLQRAYGHSLLIEDIMRIGIIMLRIRIIVSNAWKRRTSSTGPARDMLSSDPVAATETGVNIAESLNS